MNTSLLIVKYKNKIEHLNRRLGSGQSDTNELLIKQQILDFELMLNDLYSISE